jgi:ribosome maturation protein SDO1
MAISVEKAVIARLSRMGEKFEILVDPEKALEFKMGRNIPLEEVVVTREIYEDSKKGLRAATEKVNKIFGTNNYEEIVLKILKDGEVQLTTEQRKHIIEERTKAIANIISKQGINPQTNTPHPPDRVLRAMEQAKVRIDIDKKPEEQVDHVLKAIQPIIPIRFEKLELAIKIGPEFAGKASNVIRNFGTMLKEEWKNDGTYLALIEIPAGIQQDIYDRLNSLTHGQAEVKAVKKV